MRGFGLFPELRESGEATRPRRQLPDGDNSSSSPMSAEHYRRPGWFESKQASSDRIGARVTAVIQQKREPGRPFPFLHPIDFPATYHAHLFVPGKLGMSGAIATGREEKGEEALGKWGELIYREGKSYIKEDSPDRKSGNESDVTKILGTKDCGN